MRLDDGGRDQPVWPRALTTACTIYRLGVVDHPKALETQRLLVEACRRDGCARLLLLEHPPTYTLAVRGRQEHLLVDEDALAELGGAVHQVDRGGDVTFHGPGRLVGYPTLNLERWNQGPVWYVRSLEAVLIEALAAFGINAQRVPSRPGAWVGKAKIAVIAAFRRVFPVEMRAAPAEAIVVGHGDSPR